MLCAMTLFVIMGITEARPETPGSDCLNAFAASPGDTETVVLTVAQADSLIRLIDEMELKIRLLEADLVEVRPVPTPVDLWIVRAIKHPVLWFGIGMVTGAIIAK